MENQFKKLREKSGLTQSQLAEATQLSLRTIQRVEASSTPPKGYTLKSLENYFQFKFKPIDFSSDEDYLSKTKLINFSNLLFIFIPILHVLIPIVVWKKNRKNKVVYKLGRYIINFQLNWIIVFTFSVITASFIQSYLSIDLSIVLFVVLVYSLFNLFIVGITASSLSKKGELPSFVMRQIQLL